MKICVIIPTEDSSQQAGVRIRYNRIEPDLAARGDHIRVATLQAVSGSSPLSDDIYIFSKCYDARAPLLAQALKGAGKIIGIDLFDDYFSQRHDSRMLRFSHWLDEMTDSIDFVLCSTPAMAQVASRRARRLPVHVMNDPAPDLDPERLKKVLRDKIDAAVEMRRIKVCWFGMGDNPHFPVGLADLVAYSHKLTELEASGYDVSLAIRTNARALTAETLAKLRRIPVPYSLDEWSVESEALLLDDSIACFIPTNGQNFSVAKSLNRALTALTRGTQVFSVGHPLYAPLDPFIYREASTLVTDVEQRTLALRPDTVKDLGTLIDRLGNIRREASSLLEFLNALPSPTLRPTSGTAKLAVIHGVRSIDAINIFAGASGAITVASPYCTESWSFDVVCRFAANATRMDVLVSEQVMLQLPQAMIAGSSSPQTLGTKRFRSVNLRADMLTVASALSGRNMTMIDVMAGYRPVMRTVEAIVGHLFPGITCVFSERGVFPYAVRERPTFENEL